ncbi:MAG: rhodanese-like domain-containing protein [Desulfuromonadales bacterium]|nr:rhodanese-like domain-containing protein [Desulfuromonadales bacterium]
MNVTRLIALTLGLLLLTGATLFAARTANLDVDASWRLLQERGDLFLLDVRTPGEYRQFRLKDARLIPIDQLERRLAEIPRDQPILVYCAVGSRSSQVVNFLARRGYPEVYNMAGGIYSWANRGYPVLQGSP